MALSSFKQYDGLMNNLPNTNVSASPVVAMRAMSRAVISEPDNAEHQIKFCNLIARCTFNSMTEHTAAIKEAVRICLVNNNVRSILLFKVWHSLLILDDNIVRLMKIAKQGYTQKNIPEVTPEYLDQTINNPFFIAGVKHHNLIKLEYEYLLTFLRRYFLLSNDYDSDVFVSFLLALAEQCNHSEYIYSTFQEEQKKIQGLKKDITIESPIDTKTMAKIALIGSYEELSKLEIAEQISALAKETKNENFIDLVKLQIDNPKEVKKYHKDIPSFSQIENSVSSSVAKQYEENPYPRWRYINIPTLTEQQKNMSMDKEILVAGCGTGHELVNIALFYPNAHVLGIDLSLPSLAYGKQKADELGIDNVEFMQGDILKVERLNKKFDMITSGGVLHHMQEPVVGWHRLVQCLKPEGVMKVALYSEIARKSVVLCREWIEEKGFKATTEGIKEFRRAIMALEDSDPLKEVIEWADFHSLSMCRDLVFHVQEHRFTLPQIQEILDELEVTFIALRCNKRGVLNRYKALYPDDPEARNLQNWHQFELENPHIFSGMYPFWMNKSDSKNPGQLPEWVFAQ